jgi:hypothetical protein
MGHSEYGIPHHTHRVVCVMLEHEIEELEGHVCRGIETGIGKGCHSDWLQGSSAVLTGLL